MSENSKIQWTDSTGGPWLGCTEVSPGCANCYARELMQARLFPIIRRAYKAAGLADWETRPVWGDKAPRVLTKGFWDQAISFDRKANREGRRLKMFPSMIDWLDEMPAGIIDQDGNWLEPIKVLADFLDVIRRTENLDWLLLTKRTENWRDRIAAAMVWWDKDCPQMSIKQQAEVLAAIAMGTKVPDYVNQFRRTEASLWLGKWLEGKAPDNCWIGTTVEDQTRADERIPHLLKIPAKIRFLSVEPMLEEISLGAVDATFGDKLQWIIVGGESGPKARPFNIEWARSIVRQCHEAGVPVFCKQMGSNPVTTYEGMQMEEFFTDKKGGNILEWPADLRIRQFPESKVS